MIDSQWISSNPSSRPHNMASGMKLRLLAGAALGLLALPAGAQAQTDPAPAQTGPAPAQSATDPSTIQRDQVLPSTSPAQTAEGGSGNEIVVTGSRIARSAVTAQPTEVLGASQIADRGYTNLGTALQELPAFGIPANSAAGSQGSFSAGQTYVDLYNLGSQRTLSLVDGHRFVTSATSSIFGPVAGNPVDFSQLPTSLVDRVEVVSIGGAPIYGSDAIAGTVNVILKHDYQGLEVNAQNGVSQKGDGADYNVSLLAGKTFSGGRGNVTLSVQYDRQYGIQTSDRPDDYANKPFFTTALAGSTFQQQLYYGGQRYSVFTNTGIPLFADSVPNYGGKPFAAITNAQGQSLVFNAAGALVPFNNGSLTGSKLIQAGGDGFAIGNYDNFLSDSHRIQTTTLFHYDFSDHFRFKGEGWYSNVTSTNLAAQPFYNTALFNDAGGIDGNLILSTANPYLSNADRATIVSSLVKNGSDPTTFLLTRANTDLASGSFRTSTELYRFVGGFEGDFAVGSHNFNWEVNANYGHTRTETAAREIVTQNYYNALNAVRDGSGNIVCAPGYTSAAIATISSTCAPLDVFGVNQASQAAINYVTAIARPIQTNSQLDIIADIGGSIFKLPAGDVKFSIGYEHRREATSFDPGAFYSGQPNGDGTSTQYGNSIPIAAVAGSYHTDEGFGELNVPVVSPDMHVPLIHSLEIQGAGRYVHNSLTGGFVTYTGGGTYAPIRDITFRGNYTRSFRAPAITEAFAPTASVFDSANDPCDARYINGGPDPSRRAANCAAAGITQPFTSNVADFTIQGTSGGNPNLKNEIANSWTAGGVLQPRFIPGFKASADYIHIDITNEIATLGLTNLMDACYDSTGGTSAFCNSFTRDPTTHQVTNFAEGNYNIGIESFRALQATLEYVLPLSRIGLSESAGRVGLAVNYLHTFTHYTKVGEGDLTTSVGTTQEPNDNFTANFNYDNSGFNFFFQTIYYGPTRLDVNLATTTYQYPKVDQYFMFNTSVGYDISKKFNIRLIVNNVFDKNIPFPYAVSTTRYFDAIMGRYFRVSATAKF